MKLVFFPSINNIKILPAPIHSDSKLSTYWGRKWLVGFNNGKTQLVSFGRSSNSGAIDVKMNRSALDGKSTFEMLGLSFSSKLDWGSCTASIAKTASTKIGALIRSMTFLSPEVTL